MSEKVIDSTAWDADWRFAQAGLVEEARLHNAGKCPKDPLRCYTCYVEELEEQSEGKGGDTQ